MKLKDQLRETIRVQGKSRATFKTYWSHIADFCLYLKSIKGDWVHPKEVHNSEVESWLTFLANQRQVSKTTQNCALNAVVFLYRHIIKRPLEGISACRAKRSIHVPVVPSVSDIKAVFDQLDGFALVACQLMYGCGLRRGETLRLRIKDLDFEQRKIHIHGSKGDKSRHVLFPEALHESVRSQIEQAKRLHQWDLKHNLNGIQIPYAWRRKSPRSGLDFAWYFLFSSESLSSIEGGPTCRFHKHPSHLTRKMGDAVRQSGINKRITCHMLRHAFATHSNELGTDVTVLQQLLGHVKLETTMIYVHANKDRVNRAKSPIELVSGPRIYRPGESRKEIA